MDYKLLLIISLIGILAIDYSLPTAQTKLGASLIQPKPLATDGVVRPFADGNASVRSDVALYKSTKSISLDSDFIPGDLLVAGVVRWDSIVAPFGAFDGKQWSRSERRWFKNKTQNLIWHITSWAGSTWRGSGGRLVTGFSCSRMYEKWGQKINIPPGAIHWSDFFASEEDREWAYISCLMTRIGIALSDSTPLVSMRKIAENKKERFLKQIFPIFNNMESKEVERLGHEASGTAKRIWTGHPVSAAERLSVPVELGVLEYADTASEDIRLYRFIAHRRYRPSKRFRRICPTRTTVRGLIIGAGDKSKVVNASVAFEGACSDSPGMTGESIKPFGLLNLGERSFFLGLESGWEWSAPVIYEINADELREVLRGW